jgi:hypothetical protein
MSQQTVKWGQVYRYFKRRNYEIRNKKGDTLIFTPKTDKSKRGRPVVRIGHNYCNHHGDELLDAHLTAIKRKFSVTRDDILSD